MLKYIVVLTVISVCHSMPSSQIDNDVDEIAFVQRSPVTAYEVLKELLLEDGEDTVEDVINFLREDAHTLLDMDSNAFIIHTLAGLNSSNKLVLACKDARGRTRKYENSPLTNDFKNTLKKYWPSAVGKPESEIWELFYDNYGSCINDSPLAYYSNAIRLYNNHNAGELLQRASISEGDRIFYNELINKLVDVLGVHPVISCEKIQNGRSNDQFLHEVSICLSPSYQLIDCISPRAHNCDVNERILYPTWQHAQL